MTLAGWQFEIVRPLWLTALAILPVLVYFAAATWTGHGPVRRLASLAARVLLLTLIILALCDVRLVLPAAEQRSRPDASAAAAQPAITGNRVLLVGGRPASAAPLAAALANRGLRIEVRPLEDAPEQAKGFEPFDAVVLCDVSAAALGEKRMEALRRYVRDFGGGLAAIGGEASFTPGGYRDTPLEDILPVWSEAKKNKPRPTLAIALVLDCSGSMEGKSIALAKEGTRRVVEMLGPRDQIGVVAFEERSRWVCPLHACTDKAEILRRVDAVAAGGETDMYPAIDKAYLALRDAYADRKHILVLTDGVSAPGDFDGLVKSIAADGITLSTVAIGPEAAGPLLQEMAEKGGGQYYACDDAGRLPQIFALETGIAGKLGVTEAAFFPLLLHAGPTLAGLNLDHIPTLLGYVETRPKPGARVALAAKDGDPLLVFGSCGRGATAAFTSDATPHWAAAWLRWPEFGRFWELVVRQTLRKPPAAPPPPAPPVPSVAPSPRTLPLWRTLLAAAVALFVLDVCVKRL